MLDLMLDQSPGSGRLSPASCAWSCKVKETETGVCNADGNCICSGELEDPDEIFENNSDDSEDVRVGIFTCRPEVKLNLFFPGVA